MCAWDTLAASLRGTPEQLDALAVLLRDCHEAGQRRWPGVALSAEDFVAHLATHVPPDADAIEHVRSIVAEDLYLACACARDVAGAIVAFDAELLSRVPGYIHEIDRAPSFADEITQIVRERLLVRRDDRPPRIADYSGRGALASWLRVVAVRVALNHRAAPIDARRVDDAEILDRLATDTSPELQVLRARYADAMTAALREAIASLAPEQRVILRMYFASNQNTEKIATILRVNRSTAARRLVAARQAVFDETHRILRAQIPLDTAEFTSLARVLHDQLNVSLGGLLAEK